MQHHVVAGNAVTGGMDWTTLPDGLELLSLLQQSAVLLKPRHVGNPEVVRLTTEKKAICIWRRCSFCLGGEIDQLFIYSLRVHRCAMMWTLTPAT